MTKTHREFICWKCKYAWEEPWPEDQPGRSYCAVCSELAEAGSLYVKNNPRDYPVRAAQQARFMHDVLNMSKHELQNYATLALLQRGLAEGAAEHPELFRAPQHAAPILYLAAVLEALYDLYKIEPHAPRSKGAYGVLVAMKQKRVLIPDPDAPEGVNSVSLTDSDLGDDNGSDDDQPRVD